MLKNDSGETIRVVAAIIGIVMLVYMPIRSCNGMKIKVAEEKTKQLQIELKLDSLSHVKSK